MRSFLLKKGQGELAIRANRGREPVLVAACPAEYKHDAADLIVRALDNPIDSPPLRDIASPGDKVDRGLGHHASDAKRRFPADHRR